MTFFVNYSGKIVKASQNKHKILLSSIFVSKSEDTKAKKVLIQCCTPQSKKAVISHTFAKLIKQATK